MALNSDHKDVNETAITHHNKLRVLHHSPPVTMDWNLAKSAQAYAEKLAKSNSFSHSDSQGKYGENLASSFNSRAGYVFGGDQATQNWYDEIKDYKFNQEKQENHKIGHFSQVVWKSTTSAGFGRAKSESGNFIIVGQYKPPGNFIGQYMVNVLKPSGTPPKLDTPEMAAQVESTKSSKTNESITSQTSGPKSKEDKLTKRSTKNSTINGKLTTEIIETFVTPSGKTYDVSKIQTK